MTSKDRVDLSGMDRSFFEALSPEARVELLCRLHALAVEQAEKLAQDPANSSRPPSCDGPFGPASGALVGKAPPSKLASAAPEPPSRSGREPGKPRGSKGIWRCEALEAERSENHDPARPADPRSRCGIVRPLTAPTSCSTWRAPLAASGSPVCCTALMRARCACGVAARPGVGALSAVPGRARDLLLSEAGLVGPAHLHRRPVGALSRVACQDP